MATLEVPNRYLGLAPIVVTSPTPRCGTTLVQRLLTASSNAFVYGEEIGHQVRTLTGWLLGLLRHFEETYSTIDPDFQSALDGTLTDWRPGLTAPTEVMRRAWIETYYQLPSTLAEFSASVGRPVWGFKTPGYTRDMMRTVFSMMPNARVIYLIRDLRDVVKSAKARRFVTSEAEARQLSADWARNIREMVELAADERVLFLKYEDLLARREEHVRLLELFTGAEGIDAGQFDLKVNTFLGLEAEGHSPTQYIAPAELTAAELEAIEAEAGPIVAHFYGGPLAA
jgi:hypothetical protein